MIKRLFANNFRCLVNFEINFNELNLIVGLNGSGKSSLFDIFVALRSLMDQSTQIHSATVFPSTSTTRWLQRANQIIELDLELDGRLLRYRLVVEHKKETSQSRISEETLVSNDGPLFEFRNGKVQLYRDDHSRGPDFPSDWTYSALARVPSVPENSRLTGFRNYLRRSIVCRLNPAAVRSSTTSEAESLDLDGANFVAWYRNAQQERPRAISDYFKILGQVLPGCTSAALERDGDSRQFFLEFNGYKLRLDELSEGQRALVILYATLFLAADRVAILIDEPDNYVAISEIQPWLDRLSDFCGDAISQALLISHNAEVLNHLTADRSLLIWRESDEGSRVKKLDSISPEEPLAFSELMARGWLE